MDFEQLKDRALAIRTKYTTLNAKRGERTWGVAEYTQGMVGDVGDLVKLVMAKGGFRAGENVDAKLKHELGDVFWSLIVIANELGIDLDQALLDTMGELEQRLQQDRE